MNTAHKNLLFLTKERSFMPALQAGGAEYALPPTAVQHGFSLAAMMLINCQHVALCNWVCALFNKERLDS